MAVPLGRRARLPRAQRVRQDDDDPDAARARSAPTPAPPRCSAQTVPERLPHVIDRVGAIVESPKFFPAFTGRQNLRLLAERDRQPPPARRRGARGDAPRRPGPRPVRRLLARHEAAPRHRGDAAQGPRPAHLRRAHQRARPRRHPRGARHDEDARRTGQDGARQLAHPRRGRAGRRHRVDHRARRRCSPRGRVSDILGGAAPPRRCGSASPPRSAPPSVLEADGFTVTRDGEHLARRRRRPGQPSPAPSPATASTSAS